VVLSLSDSEGVEMAAATTERTERTRTRPDREQARLDVSRIACELFWAQGVAATSGDDIAARAGLSTRTIWRYFRTKESCVEPVLHTSADRFLASMNRWPAALSLTDHLRADLVAHPLTERDVADEFAAMRIAALSLHEPALRTSYLMVHDTMEKGLVPVIAARLGLAEDDMTVRLAAAAVTGAFRVVDEQVSVAIIVRGEHLTHAEGLALMDRAIRDATNGRLGGPTDH
jgi:AcrR family transcriptional regulator